MNPVNVRTRVARPLEEVHDLHVLGQGDHQVPVNVHDALRLHLEALVPLLGGARVSQVGQVVDVAAVRRGLHEGPLENPLLNRLVGKEFQHARDVSRSAQLLVSAAVLLHYRRREVRNRGAAKRFRGMTDRNKYAVFTTWARFDKNKV